MQTKNQVQTLQQYLAEILPELQSKAPKDSGALANSIEGIVDGKAIDLTVSMLSYGKFINKGVNGINNSVGSIYSYNDKMPPASAFGGGNKGFAIARSVYKNGIKPSLFIDNTVTDSSVEELANNLVQAVWDDFYEQTNETK